MDETPALCSLTRKPRYPDSILYPTLWLHLLTVGDRDRSCSLFSLHLHHCLLLEAITRTAAFARFYAVRFYNGMGVSADFPIST